MRSRKIPALIPLCLSGAMLLSAGCATIAGGYRVADNSSHVRGYTSIAGDIDVGRQAKIGSARTVAGNIEIGAGSRVGSLSSVAGRIRLGEEVKVGGSIHSVAGDIEIARGCTVAGDISTVAGKITLTDTAVEGNVTLSNGNLKCTGTRVTGTLRIKYKAAEDARTAEVNIGPGSEVAALVVDRKAEVHLRIHRTAKVGSVAGAQAEYYD